MNDTLIIIVDGKYNYCKVNIKRGFKELLEDIKMKYSDISSAHYNYGYFDPHKRCFVIYDHELQKYDELEPTECILKKDSGIYINNQSFQAYSGKVNKYIYPKIYKILNQQSIINILVDLNEYISEDNDQIKDYDNEIIKELFEYIDFELLLSLEETEYNDFSSKNKGIKCLELNNLEKYINTDKIKIKKRTLK